MEDSGIVDLYLARDEAAIGETSEKYGKRLRALALGICGDLTTAEECENDTYLKAWESITPHEPRTYLFSFLAKITRCTALDRVKKSARQNDLHELTDEVDDNNMVLGSFYFNLKCWDIDIPEEYMTTDPWGNLFCFKRMTGTLPSELFEQFGVSPLMNDNFSENIDFKLIGTYDVYSSKNEYLGREGDYGYPILYVDDADVGFCYRLYDKNVQRTIELTATYPISDKFSLDGNVGVRNRSDFEMVKLKDGSMCCIYAIGANFSYEGVLYDLEADFWTDEGDELSIKRTKQVLKDLGVL